VTPEPENPEATDSQKQGDRTPYDEAEALRQDRILAAELEASGVDISPVDDRLPEQIDGDASP